MREGAAHIVVFPAPGFNQALKFRHNAFPAAVTGVVHAEAIVNLFAAVQTQHHVAHLSVGKVDDVVIDQHAVGGQGKAEVFSGLPLAHAGIGNQLFYGVEVHQRFAAEEIHLQVVPGSGMFD